jgi:glucosamine--fructose-6-phosphate aminotransferase (isomerizing)
MCGVFGVIVAENSLLKQPDYEDGLSALYRLSESRGKESAGLCAFSPKGGDVWIIKEARRATELLRSEAFAEWKLKELNRLYGSGGADPQPFVTIAHSRLVTNGTAELPENNQPVKVGKVNVIHNGIVVNVDQVWGKFPALKRSAEVDTEVIAALLNSFIEKGESGAEATRHVFSHIQGSASIAWLHEDIDLLTLATNTGDMYYCVDLENRFFAFASERYILNQALKRFHVAPDRVASEVSWLRAGEILEIRVSNLASRVVAINTGSKTVKEPVELGSIVSSAGARKTHLHTGAGDQVKSFKNLNLMKKHGTPFLYDIGHLTKVKRCAECILPANFPFIYFDAQGVCNYCRNYKPRYRGKSSAQATEKFLKSIESYRRPGEEIDVLVPFSGGRDSSYGLHLIKKEFGLKPITFTYDWGMVADLARRNVARVCGALGVQNILVSADLKKKRHNIKVNVEAWLKRPDLGMIPLFMAGDKHFFQVANQIKDQTGLRLNIWSANPLENTDFKSGLCGVAPISEKSRIDYLSIAGKLKMLSYYSLAGIRNPRYINSSVFDTISAFSSYYFEPREDFFSLFHEIPWDERVVNETLFSEYDWEIAPDSTSTWRIGDATAPFYNYIYVTALGYSEFDTFRSNQIREGMISREDALAAVLIENQPRETSIANYLDLINVDFDFAIGVINRLSRT